MESGGYQLAKDKFGFLEIKKDVDLKGIDEGEDGGGQEEVQAKRLTVVDEVDEKESNGTVVGGGRVEGVLVDVRHSIGRSFWGKGTEESEEKNASVFWVG